MKLPAGNSEADLQRLIIQYLDVRHVWCRRYLNRAFGIGGRPIYPIRRPDNKPDNGHPDIIAKTKNETINIECKTIAGKQSDEQKAWQAEAEARGETYILARSLDDVRCLFDVERVK